MSPMRLWADFNEVYDDDFIWTSLRRSPDVAPDMVGIDQIVELFDADGATCWATIVETKGHVVTCKLNWTQWRSMAVTSMQVRFPHGFTSAPIASPEGVPVGNG